MQYKDGITIVVPVYNSEKTIERCIESVVNQNYPNWYLILVDDGSVDASPEICDNYAQRYEKISVLHKENGGVSSARNMGISNVKTQYLSFLDSDDYIDEDYLSALYEAKNTYPESQNIWCSFGIVEDNVVLKSNIVSDTENVSVFGREQLMTLHGLWQVQGPVCKLYHTALIHENDIKCDIESSLGEDLMFNLDYLDICDTDIVIINRCLYYYEKTDSGLNSVYRENGLEIKNKLNDYIKSYIDKWCLSQEQYDLFYNSCFHGYDDMISRISANKNIGFVKRYKSIKAVLSSKEFREAFSRKNCYVNPILNKFYKFGSGGFVIIFYCIVNRRKSK